MQRSTPLVVGASFVLALALIGKLARSPAPKEAKPAPVASASAVVVDPAPTSEPLPAASAAVAQPLEDAAPSAGFDLLPNGTKAPPLPDSAPATVRFGVILYNYRGAQFAGNDARQKEEARKRAAASVADAKRDFAAAAAKGDRGSSADAGRIPRGILEPAVEYALFTLPKGEVYPEPLDTPRGYWVVRRID